MSEQCISDYQASYAERHEDATQIIDPIDYWEMRMKEVEAHNRVRYWYYWDRARWYKRRAIKRLPF